MLLILLIALTTISPTGFGMWSSPSLSAEATCYNTGPQAVWIGETGTQYLDIMQIGTMNGQYFYAYGRGVPNGANSLYVQKYIGKANAAPHHYSLSLSSHIWKLSIDNKVVATISDTFRTWSIRETQVMVEGTLPFNHASCTSQGYWYFGGYGPQPASTITTNGWKV